jgi:hypothetical protein
LFFLSCSSFFVPFSTLISLLLRVFLHISFSFAACFTLNFYHLNVSYIFSQTSRTFSIELRLSSFVCGKRWTCYWKFCIYLRYVQVGAPYRQIPMWSPLVLSLSWCYVTDSVETALLCNQRIITRSVFHDMIWYDMIYLLTAIVLTPGGRSTVHICIHTIHRTTQWNRIYRTYITIRIHKHNYKNT